MKDPALAAFMATMLFMALIAVLVGCNKAPNNPVAPDTSVNYIYDDVHGVSCWTFGGGYGSNTAAISCLPARDVRNP